MDTNPAPKAVTRECVDCKALPDGERPKRPRPTNGAARKPRCSTHARHQKRASKARRRETTVTRVFALSPAEYRALLAYQGGVCYVCQRATGASKALAVDHDHSCCPGDTSCGQCVRGLLCSTCNYIVLGRYSITALRRAIEYLEDPPMARLRRLFPDLELVDLERRPA